MLWLAAVLLAALPGCSPLDSGPLDEEKEPHYELGKSRVNAMDYGGAIKAFEESLETNPHSAQAHYQLAILYENQESDPAAAIYHYQEYLKYDPKAENAEVINQHIATCKQQLAADVLQLPSAPAAQQQIEKLTDENRRLRDQLGQWQAYYAAQLAAARTNPPVVQYNNTTPTANSAPAQPATSPTPDDITPQTAALGVSPGVAYTPYSTNQHKTATARVFHPRTHQVASGETMASIARKLNVSLAGLEGANPTINPKKLKAGQVLNLPPP